MSENDHVVRAIRDVRMPLYDYDDESRRRDHGLEERISALEEQAKGSVTVTVNEEDALAKVDPADRLAEASGRAMEVAREFGIPPIVLFGSLVRMSYASYREALNVMCEHMEAKEADDV